MAEARGLGATIPGTMFQIKLAMYALLRSMQACQELQISVATDLIDAAKFDDVVIRFSNNKYIFIQAKHKKEGTKKKIKMNDLLTDANNADFGLPVYFRSYRKIARNETFADAQFEAFIVFTNIDFDVLETSKSSLDEDTKTLCPNGKWENIQVQEWKFEDCFSDFFNFSHFPEKCGNKSPAKFYKLKTVTNDIRKSLSRATSMHSLAKKLIINILNETQTILYDIEFLTYNQALCEAEIIKIEENHCDKRKLMKIHDRFANSAKEKLPTTTRYFREAFVELGLEEKGIQNESMLWKVIIGKFIMIPTNRNIYSKPQKPLCKLTEEVIKSEEITAFLSKLIFATNQPNEDSLTEILKDVLQEKFGTFEGQQLYEKYLDYAFNWIKNKCGIFVPKDDIENFWRQSRCFVEFCKMRFQTEKHHKIVNDAGIKFKELGNAYEFIKSAKQFLLIWTTDHILTLTKLFQFLQLDTDNRAHLVLNIHDIVRLSASEKLAFQYEHMHDLIIIFDERLTKDQQLKCLKNWEDIQISLKSSNTLRTVVVICKTGTSCCIANSEDNCTIIKDKLELVEMEICSQEQLLMKNVIFQGQQVVLDEIIQEDALRNKINGQILTDIFTDRNTEIGKPLPEHDEACYIDRILLINDKIQMASLKILARLQEPKIYICISGASKLDILGYVLYDQIALYPKEQDLKDKRVVIIENSQCIFKDICKEISKHTNKFASDNAHVATGPIIIWLQKENGFLKVRSTNGSLDIIRKVLDTHINSQCSENELIEKHLVHFGLITGEPGMGKSSLLLSLAHKIKHKEPMCWVIFINLNDCIEILVRASKSVWNHEMLLDFLCKAANITENLEMCILKHMLFHNERVVLLIDSFDEISPKYDDHVYQFFDALNRSKVKQIWVTTRTHLQLQLENKFNTLAFSVQKLSPNNQAQLLKAIWKINELAESYITLQTKIDEHVNGFLENPLHCKMFAEVYLGDSVFEFDKPINLTKLYQIFFEKTYSIFSVKMKDNQHNPNYESKHRKEIAIDEKVYGKTAVRNLFPEYAKTACELKQIEIEDIERCGILKQGSGKFQFVHQTYAEYFAAMFLCEQIKNQHDAVIKFLYENMFLKNNDTLRIFIDQKLAEDQDIFQSIIMHDEQKLEEVLNTTGAISQVRDDLGRNALHYAAAYGSRGIYGILSNSNKIGMMLMTQKDKFKAIPIAYLSFNVSKTLVECVASNNHVQEYFQSVNLRSLGLAITISQQRGHHYLIKLFVKNLSFESTCSLLYLVTYRNILGFHENNMLTYKYYELREYICDNYFCNNKFWNSFHQFEKAVKAIIDYAAIAKNSIDVKSAPLLQLLLHCATKSQRQAIWKISDYQRVFSERLDACDYEFCEVLLKHASKHRIKLMLENSNFATAMKSAIKTNNWSMVKLLKHANRGLKDEIIKQFSYIETFKNSILENSTNGFQLYEIANEHHQKAIWLSIDFQKCFSDAFERENWKMAIALYEHSSNSEKCYILKKLNNSQNYLTQKFSSNIDIDLLSFLFRCLTFESNSHEMPALKSFLSKTSNIVNILFQPSNDVARQISINSIINNAIETKNTTFVENLLSHANNIKRKAILNKIDHVTLAYEAIYEMKSKVLNEVLRYASNEQLQILIPTSNYIQIAKDAFYQRVDCNFLEIALRYAHSQNQTIFGDDELLEAVKMCCNRLSRGETWKKKMHFLFKYALDHQWQLILTNMAPNFIMYCFRTYDLILSDYKIKAISDNNAVLAAYAKEYYFKVEILANLLKNGHAGQQSQMLLNIFQYKTVIPFAIQHMHSHTFVMAVETVMNTATEAQRRKAIARLNIDDIIKDAQSGNTEPQLAALTMSRYVNVESKQRIIHAIDYKTVYKINEPHTAAVLRQTLEEEHWKEILKQTDFSGSQHLRESESRISSGDEDNSYLQINFYALDCLLKHSSDDQRRMLINNEEIWKEIPLDPFYECILRDPLLFQGIEIPAHIFHVVVERVVMTLDSLFEWKFEILLEAKKYMGIFKILLREGRINKARVMVIVANNTLQKKMLHYFVKTFSRMTMPMCNSDKKVKKCYQILKDFRMEEKFLKKLDLPKICQDCTTNSSMTFLNAVSKHFSASMKNDLNEILMTAMRKYFVGSFL